MSTSQAIPTMVPADDDLRQELAKNPRLLRPADQGEKVVIEEMRKPRLTVLETVYFQEPGSNPTSFENSFSITINDDEQPCLPRIVVSKDWQPLATKKLWLEKVCQLVVRNDDKTAVVEIGVNGTAIITIPPGQSARFQPAGSLDLFFLRIVGDKVREARVTLAAFPT